MRAVVPAVLCALALATTITTASAAPVPPTANLSSPVSDSVPAASHNCGKGYYWVPGGYGKHGRYRGGHCASR